MAWAKHLMLRLARADCIWCDVRRVLVIHTDLSEEIVEIKDDLGFDAKDIAATRARLERQGVRDIGEIRLYA